MYKAAVLGYKGVGKTSSTIQFVQCVFVQGYDQTIEDSYRKQFIVDEEICLIEIQDTAGEEPSAVLNQYIHLAEGFILIYSITSRESFDNLGFHYNKIKDIKDNEPTALVLVGNKCDLQTQRQISKEEGEELAKEFNCPFVEISAKERRNIDESFSQLMRIMKENRNNIINNDK